MPGSWSFSENVNISTQILPFFVLLCSDKFFLESSPESGMSFMTRQKDFKSGAFRWIEKVRVIELYFMKANDEAFLGNFFCPSWNSWTITLHNHKLYFSRILLQRVAEAYSAWKLRKSHRNIAQAEKSSL